VAGAVPDVGHTVWTKEGELFTFGTGSYGQLVGRPRGGAEWHPERVPRLVEAAGAWRNSLCRGTFGPRPLRRSARAHTAA